MKTTPQVLMRMIHVAITPRGWLLKSRLSNGAIVYGQNRAGFGGRGVYIYRDAVEPELQHLDRFLDASGVFVDVGASTGIYTLKAARHFGPQGVVVAIEPFPEVLAVLQHSVRANGFSNVRLRNLCLGDCTGARTLWMNFGKPNSFGLVKRDQNASSFSALTVALDDLFGWEGLDALNYLKLDVEGAEREVLLGARQMIEKHRPIIQMEVTIEDVPIQLLDYTAFRAPGSANKVCIPAEHPTIAVPKQLGWAQLAN
jgi:FkbM family methyltransferase